MHLLQEEEEILVGDLAKAQFHKDLADMAATHGFFVIRVGPTVQWFGKIKMKLMNMHYGVFFLPGYLIFLHFFAHFAQFNAFFFCFFDILVLEIQLFLQFAGKHFFFPFINK